MMKISVAAQNHPAAFFLVLTFGIALIGFVFIATVPGAQSPETPTGLPFWILPVWSPTLAALITWSLQNKLTGQLQEAIKFPPIWTFAAAALPLAILGIVLWLHLKSGHEITWSNFQLSYLLPLLLLNLVLGPLGEELGWRGFLYPLWKAPMGWAGAALLTGAVWGIWHLPLWTVDSPQSEIPFLIFFGHTIFFSIFMSAVTNLSNGSIWPAVMIHLWVNACAGFAAILESHSAADFYRSTLWWYGALAAVAAVMHELWAPKTCAATAIGGGLAGPLP